MKMIPDLKLTSRAFIFFCISAIRNRKPAMKRGVTLIEVMVAIIIFTIVMVGGFVVFFYGRTYISHSEHQRMALELTKEKIEMCKASGGCVDLLNESIPLGDFQFYRDTSIEEIDAPDGSEYEELTVETKWQEGGNPHSVELVTIMPSD